MLFVPRQVALASSSSLPPAAMAKEESKKRSKSKSKAAAKAAAGPDARAVVVASVASFLEAGGFPRAFAALQSEVHLEEGAWKSAAVSLEDLVSKFLESSGSAPVTATVGNNERDKAENDARVPSAVLEDEAGEKKKKRRKKKGDTEASEPESKVIEPSAEETPSENVGAETKEKKRKKKDDSSTEEAKETVKSDDQKADDKKKKSQKQEENDDVEARLDKASLATQNNLGAAEELKEDGGDGATDKTKKKKGKSEKIVGSVAADGNGTDGTETAKVDSGKKAKKKQKKSGSEENVPEEGKDHHQGKSALELEDGENGKPSGENAVAGKKRKLEAAEEGKTPATENGTTNQTLTNGFAEDDSKENGTMSKPSKRQKTSAEPKSVTPFQRVKMEAVKFADERLQDNSYWAKGGADIGYGAKAQEVLGQVRGRGFRHEKTKKKRGTYRGGQIDLGTHSIKFENSDDE